MTEYVQGQGFYNFLRDDNVTDQQQSKVNAQVGEVLDKLAKHHITHGDLKQSNILITANGLFLTDLDAMKVHRWNWTYKINQTKDLHRLGGDARNFSTTLR